MPHHDKPHKGPHHPPPHHSFDTLALARIIERLVEQYQEVEILHVSVHPDVRVVFTEGAGEKQYTATYHNGVDIA